MKGSCDQEQRSVENLRQQLKELQEEVRKGDEEREADDEADAASPGTTMAAAA